MYVNKIAAHFGERLVGIERGDPVQVTIIGATTDADWKALSAISTYHGISILIINTPAPVVVEPSPAPDVISEILAEHHQVCATRLQEVMVQERERAVAEFAAEIQAVLHDQNVGRTFKLQMIQDIVNGGTVQCLRMYVQQSQLEEFNRTNANLLTLSRSNAFPFTTPLKVIA